MIKAVIFDFDGVLIESFDIKTIAFARLFEAEGESVVDMVVKYHKANGGVSRFDKFRYFYREILHRELTESHFESLCARFSGLVMEEVVTCPFVPGAIEFLTCFSGILPCYVASATPANELAEILSRRGMTNFFPKVFGAPTSKTAAIESILNETGLLPQEVIFVGDALSDYEAATVSGTHFIARCSESNRIFDAVNCLKISDLKGLYSELVSL